MYFKIMIHQKARKKFVRWFHFNFLANQISVHTVYKKIRCCQQKETRKRGIKKENVEKRMVFV